MSTLLLFFLLAQNLLHVQLELRVQRDVRSSSIRNSNYYSKTFALGRDILFEMPNLTLIERRLAEDSSQQKKPSIRSHTTWSMREMGTNESQSLPWIEIARYDSHENRFVLTDRANSSLKIDGQTGELTIVNENDKEILLTEISVQAESGLADGDEILHDVYRLVRLSPTSLNCSGETKVNLTNSIDIVCEIEYEYFKSNDFPPAIDLNFYLKEKNSTYIPTEFIDVQIGRNSLHWKRSIRHTVRPTETEEKSREYLCILSLDGSSKDEQICRTSVHFQSQSSAENDDRMERSSHWDLIDRLIIIFIVVSCLLFLLSFILCLIARQVNQRRRVQIKPDVFEKPLLNCQQPVSKTNFFTNNNKIPCELPRSSANNVSSIHRHKPGCPKYVPSSDSNLLTSQFFTNIDKIKKIILPDIPETGDVLDDQTYVRFYIPSTNENLSIRRDVSSN